MQFLDILIWMVLGGASSLAIAGFEAKHELLRFPVRDKTDRMMIIMLACIFATILGAIGGVAAANGGGLIAFACLVLATPFVLFVIYRVANFARWINRSIDEHPSNDLGSRRS